MSPDVLTHIVEPLTVEPVVVQSQSAMLALPSLVFFQVELYLQIAD